MSKKTRELSALVSKVWYPSVSEYWMWASIILVLAMVLRVAFFSGALGSDELVYSRAALRILHGEWDRTDYIGAMRYGINIPLSLWMRLFGYGELGMGGLYFACSGAEVVLALFFARYLWGERAALWSALIVAVLPLNVAVAGSLNPDAYLALLIELSIVTFYFAQRDDSRRLYFLAGLLAGWVFWIKEVVIIYGFVFPLLAASEMRWGKGWLWFIFGGTMGVLADLVLFWSLYGDPLFQFHTIGATVAKIYVAQNIADTSLSPYLVYLFIKIYHTGLLGWLALMGCIAALRRPHDGNLRFVLIWGCGLLLIFSALPISLSPLKFVAKQTNYMVIFLMPFALLAGWFLSQRRHAVRIAFGAALVGSSILLSAMEQQVIRVVTANGQTAIDFAKQHPNEPTFGSETVSRQSVLNRVMNGSLDDSKDIRAIGDLRDLTISSGQLNDIVAYVIEDPQLSHWQSSQKDEGLIHKIQLCGGVVERLPFPDNLGWGRPVVGALYNASALLPLVVAGPIRTKLETIYKIESATVYSITRECDQILRAF